MAPRPPSPEEPLACSICLEPPITFGLLSGLSLAAYFNRILLTHQSFRQLQPHILYRGGWDPSFVPEVPSDELFCQCLRKWRDPNDKSGDIIESRVNKKCPYCRTHSRLIIPSSLYYPDGHPGKAEALEKYKGSLARVHCKYVPAQSRMLSGIDVK